MDQDLKKLLSVLPRNNTPLLVVDFDNTIFSRHEQLTGTDDISLLLQENRGNKGNEVMRNVIGIETMMKIYYEEKEFPQDIVSQMVPGQDLILTAGYEDIQTAKIQATKLTHFPLEVVLHADEKPQRLLEYIAFRLKRIPEKIVVYEDRPNHFLEKKEELENILGTHLEIMYVEMIDNQTPPHIKKLA